jgi:hypothetical protein
MSLTDLVLPETSRQVRASDLQFAIGIIPASPCTYMGKERRGYSHLKEEALDRSMWTARFGRGFGPVARQTTK